MSRPVFSALASAVIFGAGLMLVSPGIAQASPSATVPNGVITWFSGYTYPDTTAGYSACVAMGQYERSHGVWNYSCQLGNPDAGVWNLWLSDLT